MQKRVKVIQKSKNLVESLTKDLKISKILAQLLLNRDLDTAEKIKDFIESGLSSFHDPFLFADMERSCQRIVSAIENRENICVYGDYDVDGTVATSLMILFFRELGIEIDYYIPHRIQEGYSLNKNAIATLKEKKTDLIITVDNGSMAHEAIAYANELGIDVIVTDHHQLAETLPPAYSVINPQREDCPYPFAGICGAGVAYKLIIALRSTLRQNGFFNQDVSEPNLRKYLDLLSIPTVCDVVPIIDENRTIVKKGLQLLPYTKNIGLRELLRVSGSQQNEISASDLGFRIGPRINAGGRLDHASLGVELFTTTSLAKAKSIAEQLDFLNQERQEIEKKITEEALLEAEKTPTNQSSILILGQDWHLGIVGIVASRIVDKLHKPTFVFCEVDGGLLKGSGRSIPGINLVQCLENCHEHLEAYGGHEVAAGATLKKENWEKFKNQFEQEIQNQISQEGSFEKVIEVDEEISVDDIDWNLLEEIHQLEPHGMGNKKPLFVSKNFSVIEKRVVGEKHVKLTLENSGKRFQAIAFHKADELESLKVSNDFVFSVENNFFRGKNNLQLVIKEWL